MTRGLQLTTISNDTAGTSGHLWLAAATDCRGRRYYSPTKPRLERLEAAARLEAREAGGGGHTATDGTVADPQTGRINQTAGNKCHRRTCRVNRITAWL